MGHIFLVGFMGAGKSTVGKMLAEVTGRQVLDTDDMVVAFEGRRINDIFKYSGEGYFRRLETLILKKLENNSPSIVACGGGVAIRAENVSLMKTMGTIVYLEITPKTVLKRVERSHHRPLLEGKKNIKDITELMDARVPFYSKAADITISVDNKEIGDIIKEIRTSTGV